MNHKMILFTDVGGVLLNNGWDTAMRDRAADHFGINKHEMQLRHEMVFDDFERGKLLLVEYLQHVVFNGQRNFTMQDFIQYLFSSSTAFNEMIQLYKDLKAKTGIQICALSNEGREIAENRFKRFNFDEFIDLYLVSGFVGYRKPDLRMYQMALAVSKRPPEQIIYVDDRLNLVSIAKDIGMQAIHHKDYASTKSALEKLVGG